MLSSDFDFDSQAFDLNNFDFDVNGIDLNDFSTFNEADAFDFSFNQSNFPIERHSTSAASVDNHHGLEWVKWDGFSPSSSANLRSELVQDAGQSGTNLYSRDVDLPDRPRPGSTIDQSWSHLYVEPPEPSIFSSGPSERAIASVSSSSSSVPSSSSCANSLEWAASLYWTGLGSPTSPTEASSPEAVRSTTNSTSLQDGTIEAAGNLENFSFFRASSREYLSQPGELDQLRGHLDARLKHDPTAGFSVDDLDSAAPSPKALVSQLQLSATSVENTLQSRMPSRTRRDIIFDSEDSLQRRLSQLSARRLSRSLCATVTSLEAMDGESSPATGNTRVLTSQHNKQLLVSPAERRSRGMLLPTALPQPSPTTPPLPGIAEAAALPLTMSTMDHQAMGKQSSGAGQLEIAGRLLPVILLVSTMAATIAIFPVVVQLAVQFLKLVTVTGTMCVGNDSSATAVELPAVSFNRPRTTDIAPSALLAVAASLLPLSIGSSGSLVSVRCPPEPILEALTNTPQSTKHTLSKHFRKPEASHWFGMLKRLSIGSSIL
jgi:hypothetical protein